jgi:hypothetical protein
MDFLHLHRLAWRELFSLNCRVENHFVLFVRSEATCLIP